jgi:hypothetical protein
MKNTIVKITVAWVIFAVFQFVLTFLFANIAGYFFAEFFDAKSGEDTQSLISWVSTYSAIMTYVTSFIAFVVVAKMFFLNESKST